MVLRNLIPILTFTVCTIFSNSSKANLGGGGETISSSILYDLNACDAFVNTGTLGDYSEFIGVATNDPGCTTLVPVGTINRLNPNTNTHSCTPGFDGQPAMCVSSDDSCTYDASSERAVRIEVMVMPGPSGSGSLSSISFYEKAPLMYEWLFGATGINNYPTQYGIRVLRAGTEIFRSEGNITTVDWTLETFDFSSNPDFTVTQATFFTIELLGYCTVGNGEPVNAWDLDNITITSECQSTGVVGGNINIVSGGTSIDICANDGISDAFDVELTGNTGDDLVYLVTDENGNILAVSNNNTFDLEGQGPGVCFIWALSSTGALTGVQVGGSVNNLTGCYALSNPIVVNRNMQGAGSIATSGGMTSITICAGDGIPDPIDVVLTGSNATNTAWVITDAVTDEILALPAAPPFDLDGVGVGVCNIYNIGYEDSINGLMVGQLLGNVSGCFGLSNPIVVTRTTASAAVISSGGQTTFNVCTSDGVPDFIDVDIIGGVGTDSFFITTDQSGNIIRVFDATNTSINFDGFGNGTCLLHHVIFDGDVTGVSEGNNIANIGGCFGLSNAITVSKQSTTGGVFSTGNRTFVSICEGDGSSGILETTLNNNVGANVDYFLADMNGMITQFISGPPFDFSSFDRGRFTLYAFSFDGASSGLSIGQNVDTLVGACNGLSNPITVSIGRAVGGIISNPGGSNIDVCVQGNVTEGIDFDLVGADFGTSRWLITDLSGNIIGLPGPPPINIQIAGNVQTCQIYHLSFDAFFTGLVLGSNIADFNGCFDLSNAITVNKATTNGGVLAGPGNTTSFNVCNTGNGVAPMTLVLNNQVGDNQLFILTDQNDNIIATQNSPTFDFSGLMNGSYRIYNLSYNGTLSGASVGSNISNISADCFDLSNFVGVNNNIVSPGTITSPLGNNIDVCTGNGSSQLVDFDNGGRTDGRWLITDANGNILSLPGAPPFDLSNINSPTCLIWFAFTSGSIGGISVGANASDITGCFVLSNSITVNKDDVEGGMIGITSGGINTSTTETTVCVGDGIADLISVSLTGNNGANNQWVITDENGNIFALPASSPFDFDGAGVGVCNIYNVSFDGTLTGAIVGNNISGLDADCLGLSNRITVNRLQPDAGSINSNGTTSVEICIDDPTDLVPVSVTGGSATGTKGWVITDAITDEILGLPAAPPFNLIPAGVGTCNIYRICSVGTVNGLSLGGLLGNLEGCFNLSNPVTVVRNSAGPGATTTSKLTFNLDACLSDLTDGSGFDYTEFTSTTMNDPACTQFSSGNLYRNDPSNNGHSCTPGFAGVAMCVSALTDCMFVDNSDLAIRFDIVVTPGSNGTGSIDQLSFYEQAPTMYTWINGASGINNYPVNYGVRVLKDGIEVFRSVDMNTTNDWTLETFDFSNNPQFTVTQASTFSFELLGYCEVGAASTLSIWDVDEIMLTSSCTSGSGDCNSTTLTEGEEEEEESVTEEEEEELASALSFTVIPNPVLDRMVIETNQTPAEGTMFYVYDRQGKMVDSYSITNKTYQVQLDKYSEGFYYVRMISGGKQVTRKFLKL